MMFSFPFFPGRAPAVTVAVAAALSWLPGCTTLAPAQGALPDPGVPAAWHQAAPTPGAAADPALLAQWWQQLGDELLADLVTQALQANPDVQQQRHWQH